ncbi:S8 family peptidase [Anaerosporobacter sp.]|uniref:S8 family peptidase n=1 Tax=Anaerosporobacter sp. TaxID=1872529 RepID=UPI00286EED59|nr:S8 family peptidase [Anaerosporobacter sp.]
MNKALDENYYDFIIDNAILPPGEMGDDITYINERHSLLHVLNMNMEVCDLGTTPYHRFPSIFTLESTISLEKSKVDEVQRNPYLALYGQGVLVGVIDTGIDYQHPVFLHADNTSRIVSIWDQTIQDGTIPDGFSFGSEYNKELINIALQSADPLSVVPTVDTDGHGTALASIAAGREDVEHDFRGVVPDAELVVVKLKEAKGNLRKIFFVPEGAVCFQESDIMLGIRYLLSVSQKLNRPLAICIGIGTSQGGHDGHGATSSYLDDLAQTPRIGVAISAGNEGNKRRHYYSSTTDANFMKDIELRIDPKDGLFSLEIWPDAPSRLAIDVITPNGESTQWVYPQIGICNKYNFIYTQSTVWINNIIFEEETGDQLILVRFQNPGGGVWRLRLRNVDNEVFSVHSWLPAAYLISDDTYFLESDPNTTITSPGNATYPLTVTAYNQYNSSILITSSRGYTRKNIVKPDVAAPGYQQTCALPNGLFGTLSGTGGAAAHSAGIIAMVLEWAVTRGNYTSITGIDINRLIIRGADRSEDYTYPNNVWGYGQIDVDGLFSRLAI